jgi:hypothetical protein
MGTHTDRVVAPKNALFKPGDFVQIRAFRGNWIIEEYLPAESVNDDPRWRCRSVEPVDRSMDYPCWTLGKIERDLYVYHSGYEYEIRPIEPLPAECIVLAVDCDLDGTLPGVWVTLSCRTFPKYASNPMDVESFLKELYDMGAIISDDIHAQIIETFGSFALAFAA